MLALHTHLPTACRVRANFEDRSISESRTRTKYAYDGENRLRTAGGVTYIYDGDGNRVKKSTGTLYWGAGPLAESDSSASASSWKEYVFFDGKRVARRDASSSTVHYYFSDHLGSTSVITDAVGTMPPEEDLDYYPYGGTAYGNPSDHYLFTGKERDTETGLDYFGARYFGSNMGRFMSPDAFYKDSHVADPQSWNLYAYARNNPLRYVDPTGENATVTTNCTTTNNQTTCNVNISASISIYAQQGSGITQEQLNQAAADMKNSIEGAWTGSFTQDGVTYNVTTQVNVSVASSEQAAMSSGAQNVIAMTNGPRGGLGAQVYTKSFGRWLSGGPDVGWMDINGTDNYAKHEFTHMLGTFDKSGAVLSNTDPAWRPFSATSQDYGWGIREATSGVNNWMNAPQSRPMRYGETWEKPSAYSDQTRVGAPLRWWK